MGLTILGIETSCDETAAAVVRVEGEVVTVLSSVVASQIAAHAPYGGVVPEIAARAHVEVIDAVIARAMGEAGLHQEEGDHEAGNPEAGGQEAQGYAALDGVAATAGPGLVGGVMVGLAAGKAIVLARGLPLMAVNHLEGHALSVRLSAPAPYPFLLLLVSGGHCQLLSVEGVGRYRRLGTTIDDAAGEAFDKIASTLGLPYPGGPALEKLAEGADPARYALPRALLGREGCDFSFSGLKTAAARLAAGLTSHQERRDLAAAVQGAIARQLVERSEKAMVQHIRTHEGAGRLFVVAGGVAANQTVRARLKTAAQAHGFAFAAPPLPYCTDNAAMIALVGAERLAAGLIDDIDVAARPRWPLDEASARDHPIHLPGRKGAKA